MDDLLIGEGPEQFQLDIVFADFLTNVLVESCPSNVTILDRRTCPDIFYVCMCIYMYMYLSVSDTMLCVMHVTVLYMMCDAVLSVMCDSEEGGG